MNRQDRECCRNCGMPAPGPFNQYGESCHRPWEDVYGLPCPKCGDCTGTIWEGEDRCTGTYTYTVPAHGRMGNKSYREDREIGQFCECGWDSRKE